jgi:isoquinoline 1-oxidoreductase beta subunit
MAIDRRTLLVGGGAAAGLVVAFALWPRSHGSALPRPDGGAVFDHYLTVAPDGRVTVAVPQVETGQGIWTALAQIAADELGADWNKVAVVPAPSASVYGNSVLWAEHRIGKLEAFRVTAESTSVRAFEAPLRHAGAVARSLLCAAAAAKWNVAAAECDTANGLVLHEGKSLPFGALAAVAGTLSPPETPPLRAAGSGKLAGRSLPRLDLPPKTDGSFRLAGDVRLPDMLFAAIRLAPEGGRVAGYTKSPGSRLIANERWQAAVAPTWWAAEQALVAAAPRFTAPSDAGNAEIDTAMRRALRDGATAASSISGDYAQAVSGTRPLAAVYEAAPGVHPGLELMTATARVTGDRLEIWAASQAPDYARRAAAAATGIPLAQTTLYPMPVGDQSGRALDSSLAPIAAILAKRAGKPVQLIASREQTCRQDRVRPPMLARLTALPNGAGGLSAWSARMVANDGLGETLGRIEGSKDAGADSADALAPPYAISATKLERVRGDLPMPGGYLRGGTATLTAFANESFVDELARALGVEPLAFRIGMLGHNLRLARVLTTAAAIGGWDGGGPGSSMGLAGVEAFGSFIALVAMANLGAEGRINVTRLVAAVDCGRIINPGLVRQQIEGGLIAGLAQAIAPEPTIRFGQIVAGPPRQPRLGAVPQIQVELIPSNAPSGGVSGLGVVALAPALANALASVTGRRLRKLPLDPMG